MSGDAPLQGVQARGRRSAISHGGTCGRDPAEASRRPSRLSEQRPPRWLDRAREILRAQFTENHSLDAIATAVGVHPAHLARAFRQHYHCTLGDYLRRLRIDFACHQLAHSDTPLLEIALAAGFADQSHFSKTFKRLVGITPAAFKKHCP